MHDCMLYCHSEIHTFSQMRKISHNKQIGIIPCKLWVVKWIFLKNCIFKERTAMMKTKIHRFLPALLVLFLLLSSFSVYADALGSPGFSRQMVISQGTVLHENTFFDATVGKQSEHYIVYTPNKDVTPILTNGASVHGKRTLTQANSFLNNSGIFSAAGVNADFFSLQTGVPMSNVIIDKRVVSKDTETLPAIGFYENGKAFIGTLPIETVMQTGDFSTPIECINKYRQPYALYLYTEDYGTETHASGKGINVVLRDISGEITLGSKVTAIVESIDEYDGSLAIPEGKWILSVSSDADPAIIERLTVLEIGDKVTFTTKETGSDSRWEKAIYGLGALGGRLITDGKLDYTDQSAAPRTAIGIRADGSIIFYTIDGRQKGYSYGVRIETLAKRMLELGCVDALNLDGGGSTTLGATLPGETTFSLVNQPSERQRSCANFLFLKKNNDPDGVPYALHVSDWGTPVLSGSSLQLTATAVDASYGPADNGAVSFSLKKDADTASADGKKTQVSKDGLVTVRGNGDVYITAKSGSLTGETMLRAIATPGELKIYHAETGKEVTALTLEKGESVSLTASAYWYGEKMVVDDGSFTWRVVSDDKSVGEITKDGKFTASGNGGATGVIGVNAGLRTYEIPVSIPSDPEEESFDSYPVIKGMATTAGFSATVTSQNGAIEAFALYVDGEKAVAELDSKTGTVVYSYPDSFGNSYHRFTLTATDEKGASAMKTFDLGILEGGRSFPDTAGHWAEHYIGYLADCGVVNGSDDGRFRPGDSMTRTEFAIMLCNYLGIHPEDYADTELPFTDTAEIPWWAMNQVKAIYALGIMQGQLTDYGVAFNPNANIQRMEYAISIERLLPKGLAKAPITATDETDIPYWGKESMKLATAQGILNGYPDGTLLPRQSVTRAEAVKILFSVFGMGK